MATPLCLVFFFSDGPPETTSPVINCLHVFFFSKELKDWHRPQVECLAAAGADLLAFETIPSIKEAEALVELLREFPDSSAWLSFSCKVTVCAVRGGEESCFPSLLTWEVLHTLHRTAGVCLTAAPSQTACRSPTGRRSWWPWGSTAARRCWWSPCWTLLGLCWARTWAGWCTPTAERSGTPSRGESGVAAPKALGTESFRLVAAISKCSFNT